MGDDDNTFVAVVVVDDDEREDGVNVDAASLLGVSIIPRCIRAVRLSDAFCLRITRSCCCWLFVLYCRGYDAVMTDDPWKEVDRAHAVVVVVVSGVLASRMSRSVTIMARFVVVKRRCCCCCCCCCC